ncbi:unnamed protein product [Rhodiola kirilowii]
MTLEYSLAAF